MLSFLKILSFIEKSSAGPIFWVIYFSPLLVLVILAVLKRRKMNLEIGQRKIAKIQITKGICYFSFPLALVALSIFSLLVLFGCSNEQCIAAAGLAMVCIGLSVIGFFAWVIIELVKTAMWLLTHRGGGRIG